MRKRIHSSAPSPVGGLDLGHVDAMRVAPLKSSDRIDLHVGSWVPGSSTSQPCSTKAWSDAAVACFCATRGCMARTGIMP